MNINNPVTVDHIKEYNGSTIKLWVKEIGVWDMDTDIQININNPFSASDIITMDAWIYNDGTTEVYNIKTPRSSEASPSGSIWFAAGFVSIDRVNAGFFDSVQFSNGVQNRGQAHVWYYA